MTAVDWVLVLITRAAAAVLYTLGTYTILTGPAHTSWVGALAITTAVVTWTWTGTLTDHQEHR